MEVEIGSLRPYIIEANRERVLADSHRCGPVIPVRRLGIPSMP